MGKNGTQKKGGGIGGRKALNDISNSAKPNNSANMISIGKDVDASTYKLSAGTKDNNSKGWQESIS